MVSLRDFGLFHLPILKNGPQTIKTVPNVFNQSESAAKTTAALLPPASTFPVDSFDSIEL